MAVDILKELNRIDDKIEKSKKELARSEGILSAISDSLKEEFNINSIEEAESKLMEMNKTLEESEIVLEREIKQLKEKMEAVDG